MSTQAGQRGAQPGELCGCGRPAVVVYLGGVFRDTGHCGLDDGGAPVAGVCVFCGDTIDHDRYWAAEARAGFPAAAPSGEPQGGRCPLYRLRLADPLPPLHPDSVEPFHRQVDLRERWQARLRAELVALFESLRADFTATYRLDDLGDHDADRDDRDDRDDGDGGGGETGDLEDVIVDICWATRQALGRDHDAATTKNPDAGQAAVAVLVRMLRPRLDELGVIPNPLDGLDARGLVEAAGGERAWTETAACDRPLLILRRVVRRALDPQAPQNIYRQWWP